MSVVSSRAEAPPAGPTGVSRNALQRPFWCDLSRFGDLTAIIHAPSGTRWSYSDLDRAVSRLADSYALGRKGLVFLELSNTIDAVISYLAALASGHAVCIHHPATPRERLESAIALFQPQLVIGSSRSGWGSRYGPCQVVPGTGLQVSRRRWPGPEVHPDLAILLSTSGSAGGAKLVRLSSRSLQANAVQIGSGLDLSPRETAATTLPLSYVYGLSVLHSGLASGAAVMVDSRPVASRALIRDMADSGVTLLPGVPWTFQTLRATGFTRSDLPTLAKMTSSGARLDPALLEWLLASFAGAGVSIYCMYGQSEAAGRIAILPASLASSKRGSVGRAVEGGSLAATAEGELLFRGPNVMMGYARDAADLARGDDLGGVLHTGDIGSIDGDGCAYIERRIGRRWKVGSASIDIDEATDFLSAFADVTLSQDAAAEILRIVYRPKEGANFPEIFDNFIKTFRLERRLISAEEASSAQYNIKGAMI